MPSRPGSRARIGRSGLLLLTPLIWGATFPATKLALETLPLLAFSAWSRSLGLLAVAAVIPFVRVSRAEVRKVLAPGALLGVLMFGAFLLQSAGIERTEATKAGFITGLYVVLTPLLGLLVFRHRVSAAGWIAALVSVGGLYLLSAPDPTEFRIEAGDALVALSAVVWAVHILVLGRVAGRHPAILLGFAQMAAAAALHVAVAAPGGLRPAVALEAWHLLVITGVLGSGVAFTIQVFGQQEVGAARAAIILAGESVVAALLSAIWLDERLLWHQWIGAAIMLAAMALSELGARRQPVERLDPAAVP